MAIIRNKSANHGFSLIELVIGVGVAVFLTLVVAASVISFHKYFFQSIEAVRTEEEILSASVALQNYLSFAVNIDRTGAAIAGGTALGTGRGRIREVLIDSMGGVTTNPTTNMAVFVRETGLNGDRSQLTPSAIWYQQPSPTRSGVLYLDNGANDPMTPGRDDYFFGRLVEFGFTDFEYSGPANALSSLQVTMTFRVFLSGEAGDWNWCPAVDIDNGFAGCDTGASFRDIRRTFRLSLRNQVLGPNQRVEDGPVERLWGNLYFFPVRRLY